MVARKRRDDDDEDEREEESRRVDRHLKELLEKTQSSQGTLQTMLAVDNFHSEALTRLLRDSDAMVCLLEQIAKETCEILNEAHEQTELQKSMQSGLQDLVELYKSEHASAAIELNRMREMQREMRKQIEACCPPERPKQYCEYQPCRPGQPPEQGSAPSNHVTSFPHQVSGAPYPPIVLTGEPEESRNEDIVPRVPVGPLRGSLAPVFQAVPLLKLTNNPDDAQGQGAAGNPVIFGTDTPFTATFSGIPPDMSGAMSGDIVFLTGNTFASYSTDGGSTFTNLNPTTIFPSGPSKDGAGNLLDNGLCCDQVIQYAPQVDRFFWLLQFCGSGANCLQGIDKYILATASPADVKNSNGTSWTYWDLTSGLFGQTKAFDYPDMSVGSNSLYLSADVVGVGLIVMRIALTQLQAGGTITIDYTTPSDSSKAYGGHITQNTGDAIFWAGHNSTSQLRVFNWQEGSNQYSWRSIDINSWPNSDYTSTCPDGTDWLNFMAGFPGSAVIGATRRFGGGFFPGPASEVYFAWTAARGGGFAHPHVEVVQIDTSNWNVTSQWQIWNAGIAFAYPCLATNSNQEVGISLGWGGPNDYASHAVGILGDFVVWFAEESDAAINRWGDYVTVRQASPKSALYAGVGYAVQKNAPPATGTHFNPRYILFGRENDVNPPPPSPIK